MAVVDRQSRGLVSRRSPSGGQSDGKESAAVDHDQQQSVRLSPRRTTLSQQLDASQLSTRPNRADCCWQQSVRQGIWLRGLDRSPTRSQLLPAGTIRLCRADRSPTPAGSNPIVRWGTIRSSQHGSNQLLPVRLLRLFCLRSGHARGRCGAPILVRMDFPSAPGPPRGAHARAPPGARAKR